MSSSQELNEALLLVMLDRAEQGGEDVGDDLDKLLALAKDPKGLSSLMSKPTTKSRLAHVWLTNVLTKAAKKPPLIGPPKPAQPVSKKPKATGSPKKPKVTLPKGPLPHAGKPCKPGWSAKLTGCTPKAKPVPKVKLPKPAKPPKPVKLTPADVKTKIDTFVAAKDKTPAALSAVLADMMKLTVSDINKLKVTLNIKATGAKAKLADDVAQMALGIKTPPPPKVKPPKAVKPPKPPKSVPAPKTTPKMTAAVAAGQAVSTLKGGGNLTPTDIQSLQNQLNSLTVPTLNTLYGALGGHGKINQKSTLVNSVNNRLSMLLPTSVVIPAPPPTVPAPATLTPAAITPVPSSPPPKIGDKVKTPNGDGVVLDIDTATGDYWVDVNGIYESHPLSDLSAPQATAPTSGLPKGGFVPKTGPIANKDREDLEHVVGEELSKLGLTAEDALKHGKKHGIFNALKGRLAGDVDTFGIERTLKGLWTMQSKVPLPAQFDYMGVGRHKNSKLPTNARPKLSSDETVAAQRWTSPAFVPWARSLRLTGHPPPELAKEDADLQSAFAKAKTFSKPVQVERHITLDPATLAKFIANAQTAQKSGTAVNTGMGVANPSYQATSTDPVPSNFHGNVEFRINAVHGLDMGPHHHHPHVKELLLDRNANLKITGVQQVGGRWIVTADQLPPKTSGKSAAPPAPPPHKTKTFTSPWDSDSVKDFISGKIPLTTKDPANPGSKQYTLFNSILTEAGKNNVKPQVLDKAGIDALKKQGWKIGHRGITKNQYTKTFKNDDTYLEGGTGARVYGTGTYFAFNQNETRAVQDAKGYGGHVMRIAMDPTAKVIKMTALRKLMHVEIAKIDADFQAGAINKLEYSKRREITTNEGLFAALHNYDAIDADNSFSDYWVLINRSKVAVQDKNV